ncbi:hypothetical protein PM082_001875 [Marasmius tenuissimus]|nr:hypothetical protein PM082_001875 [Marasmius tenuissimus]
MRRRPICKICCCHYQEKVLSLRLNILDIVEAHPQDIELTLSDFLRMLPSMRVRQYSISSPLWNAQHATLTISVLESPALSDSSKKFLGVGSNYLARLLPGDRVQMSVRPSAAAFHPPQDPSVPIVAYCAGSGLAPIRGFIKELAVQKVSGRDVGKILLFFGCRSPDGDFSTPTVIWQNGRSWVRWIFALPFRERQTNPRGANTFKIGCTTTERMWRIRSLLMHNSTFAAQARSRKKSRKSLWRSFRPFAKTWRPLRPSLIWKRS